METDGAANIDERSNLNLDKCSSSINKLILDYYKKFGRKRDIEQFFSLSTAQSDIKDPSSLFWRRMKSQNDTSDSGEKKSQSATELCRISVKCSVPEASGSKEMKQNVASDSESPPIINDQMKQRSINIYEDESKSDDAQSQKSIDANLDNSMNRPHSPSSSVTSQRKLEWDSLADVGYANESDRKNSASSLSTLERLALHQQYSNNDTAQTSAFKNSPSAHSTPIDQEESKHRSVKDTLKKSTKISNKGIDYVKLNVPHYSDNKLQPISVNLTKHISFNVERDGEIRIDNITKNISLSPEKLLDGVEIKLDKEIQTTLEKFQTKNQSVQSTNNTHRNKYPVLSNLNTLKKRNRRKKPRKIARAYKKPLITNKENIPLEKRCDQLSDAESFEYMPGHIYNQKQVKDNISVNVISDNKSSLESSTGHTTESSKESQISFTKDLKKSIDLLRKALHHRYEDSELKKKLIKEVVQRLIKSKYKNDECEPEFLAALNFCNKKDKYNTTSSTSDNNVAEKTKLTKPRKSILRTNNKINLNQVALTSQSVPNLPLATSNDTPLLSNLKRQIIITSTDSESSKKASISNPKTSSEELYKQYLESLKREEDYKKHLRSKEILFRQKLSCSEAVLNVEKLNEIKTQNRLKHLMNDLTRNNYDDGSGDASKLEYGSSSNIDFDKYSMKKHRNHSVFTLSSANSDTQNKNAKMRDRLHNEIQCSLTEGNKNKKYCCCTSKTIQKPKVALTDSSVQVNIKDNKMSSDRKGNLLYAPFTPTKEANEKHDEIKETNFNINEPNPEPTSEDVKYVCLCQDNPGSSNCVPENILIYKCSRLPHKCFMISNNALSDVSKSKIQIVNDIAPSNKDTYKKSSDNYCDEKCLIIKETTSSNDTSSKSSQTNMNLPLILRCSSNERTGTSHSEDIVKKSVEETVPVLQSDKKISYIHEATRWIQTEISIDPKISDPSLSDIRIVDDINCVKLVSEQCKEVSPLVSDVLVNEQHKGATVPSSDNGSKQMVGDSNKIVTLKSASKSNDSTKINTHNKEIQSNIDEQYENFNNANFQKQSDFSIPIHGTNMTLKVSLGTGNKEISMSNSSQTFTEATTGTVSHLCKGVETSKPSAMEKCTSLQEECSKAVQSDNVDILSQLNNKCELTSKRAEEIPNISKQNNETLSNPLLDINPRITKNVKYGTYPKTSDILKPSLYSNLDSGKVNSSCFKSITKKDADTQYDECLETDPIANNMLFSTYPKTFNILQPLLGSKLHNDKLDNMCFKGITKKDADTQYDNCLKTGSSIGNNVKYNTYPKTSNVFKSLRRSNPDTGNINNACHESITKKNDTDTQYDGCSKSEADSEPRSTNIEKSTCNTCHKVYNSATATSTSEHSKWSTAVEEHSKLKKVEPDSDGYVQDHNKDPLLNMIQDITKRYSKKNIEKGKRKKCFREIVTVLNYLLDTDTEHEQFKLPSSSNSDEVEVAPKVTHPKPCVDPAPVKSFEDKSIQLNSKSIKSCTESSDLPTSTDIPSTDSATCKVLNKIKKECEKYHHKRCQRKCEASSSTSVNCEHCNRVHHCLCRGHRCKNHRIKSVEKSKKKCVAYNLIIQTSDSVMSEDVTNDKHGRPLKNIIVKVPSKHRVENMQFKELASKIEKNHPCHSACCSARAYRSRSYPKDSEVSSADDFLKRTEVYTVKEYLEKNRPDFVEKSSERQNCLKLINETRPTCDTPNMKMVVVHTPNCMGTCNMYCGGVPTNEFVQNNENTKTNCVHGEVRKIANERSTKRHLLSQQLEREPELAGVQTNLDLLKELERELRTKKAIPKLITEKEMKKRSEKIYKSLPEVQRKKEDMKKENIKKTNLLMANLFKKNLQKKALQGAVNISNYSAVIKI